MARGQRREDRVVLDRLRRLITRTSTRERLAVERAVFRGGVGSPCLALYVGDAGSGRRVFFLFGGRTVTALGAVAGVSRVWCAVSAEPAEPTPGERRAGFASAVTTAGM
jgi:hypothetical protein